MKLAIALGMSIVLQSFAYQPVAAADQTSTQTIPPEGYTQTPISKDVPGWVNQQAESLRVRIATGLQRSNEEVAKQRESLQQFAEESQQKAESLRQFAEESRQKAESLRQQAEAARQQAHYWAQQIESIKQSTSAFFLPVQTTLQQVGEETRGFGVYLLDQLDSLLGWSQEQVKQGKDKLDNPAVSVP